MWRTRPAAPRAFTGMCQYLRLTAPQQRTWWQAITRARWSTTVQFRHQVLLADATVRSRDSAAQLLEQLYAPAHVVHLCEQLWAERLLSRPDVVALEDAVLRATTAHGHWRGSPRARVVAP